MKYVKDIGGIKHEISEALSKRSSLTDAQLIALATTGKKIEAVFGEPQDIAWGYEKEDLFFLQSRKIKGLK